MNKKLIAILTLAVFMLTLMPMGAFAKTKNETSGAIRTITATTASTELATIVITDDAVAGNSFTPGGTLSIVLPSELEWAGNFNTATDVNIVSQAGSSLAPGAGNDVIVSNPVGQRLNISFGGGAVSLKDDRIEITTRVKVGSVGSGDIVAKIEQINTGITEGTIVIGRFESKSLTPSVMTTKNVGSGKVELGTISFMENGSEAWGANKEVRLRLPANFEWDFDEYQAEYAAVGTTAADTTMTNGSNIRIMLGNTTRDLEVTRLTTEASAGILDLKTFVKVKTDASPGDISVSLSGEATGNFVIGSYKDFGITTTVAASKDVVAGRTEQEVARITIKEDVVGSLTPNRTVRFTLPSNVEFEVGTYTLDRRAGNNAVNGWGSPTVTLTERKSSIEFSLANTGFSTSTLEYRLDNVELNVKGAAPAGDLNVKIDGTAGVSASVKVAEILKPITVTAVPADVEIGRQSQMLNEFYITETKKEMIRKPATNNFIDLELPAGATWASTPKVEVVEGDLIVKEVTRPSTSNNLIVRIEIDGESTVASKLKVTDAKITTNRTIPEGDLMVAVKNNAVVVGTGNLMTFKIATVVTPAVDGTVKPVVMTVGSTVYTVDGVEMTMDVAPYVKTGRTFFPVRFVASAVGIGEDNVVWDGAQRTVTIFRANRIVQVTIGSTTMLVNGIPLTMDVAPEITAGRTMLPIRFVAQGLGVNVDWDAATQTVTLR